MTGRVLGFRVSLFGVRLAVVSDSAATAEVLDRYVLPWLPRAAIDGEAADRRVEVRCAGGGAGLDILVDDVVVDTAPSPLGAIPGVQRALDEAVVQRQTGVAVVHGGVVARDGRAILLPGPTGAGKSTLVAELVRRGALYLSDEYALIDGAGRVHPYPRSLLVRERSGEGRPMLATDLGGAVAHEPVRPSLILELRHVAEGALSLESVTQGDGVLLLLRNTPQVLADKWWLRVPLERAVQDAACYTGRRGEAREAAAAVLDLARRLHVRSPS
jgi:hypothetical protein